ncbi:hypothetical protein [Streptomyces sp. NPDC058664]|uniref:hypothetical protein n=1 Tax=unclassified Streptomyces TaxID=2593676 RepID=UPI00364E777D
MFLSHHLDGGTLILTLHRQLDVANRAAAALRIQDLIDAHRADDVVLELPGGPPTAATVSAVARAKKACDNASIPLTVVNGATERVGALLSPLSMR